MRSQLKLIISFVIALHLVLAPSLILAQGRGQGNSANPNTNDKPNNSNRSVRVEPVSPEQDSDTPPQINSRPDFVGQKSEVQVEPRGNSTVIRTRDNRGVESEIELSDQEADDFQVVVEEDSESEEASRSSYRLKRSGNRLTVAQARFAAKTNYPLSVNSETNELIVSTPAGTRTVTVLPDEAITNMLSRGVLDTVDEATDSGEVDEGDEATDSATPSASLDGDTPELELTTNQEGELVYQVEGVKTKRLLGLLPVGIRKQVQISAETGEVVSEQPQGFWARFINAFSL